MKLFKYSLVLVLALVLFAAAGWAQEETRNTAASQNAAVQNTLASPDTLTTPPASQELSLWGLALKGGWLMLPLVLLSIASIYVFFERIFTINKAAKVDPRFMDNIKECINDGRIEAAKALCQREQTPIARMIEKGLSHLGRPLADIREAVENVGSLECARLERYLPMIASTSGGAPMIGFLGTVIGMVQAFYNMSINGNNVNIGDLSGGIYTAMVTTVAGLIVGIIAYFEYNYLTTRIKSFVNKMEANAIYFMDILNEPSK